MKFLIDRNELILSISIVEKFTFKKPYINSFRYKVFCL